MQQSNNFIKNLTNADGFILKSRSPSCGVRSAKYYPKEDSNSAIGSGPGIFTKKIIEIHGNATKASCLNCYKEHKLSIFHDAIKNNIEIPDCELCGSLVTVSYTHLTLPTNREV